MEERGRDEDAIDRFSRAVASDPTMVCCAQVSLTRCGDPESSMPRSPNTWRSSRSIRRRATPGSVAPWRWCGFDALPRHGPCSRKRFACIPNNRVSHSARSCAGGSTRRCRAGWRASVGDWQSIEKTTTPRRARRNDGDGARRNRDDSPTRGATASGDRNGTQRATRRSGDTRLSENLRRYESRMPSRTPWPTTTRALSESRSGEAERAKSTV